MLKEIVKLYDNKWSIKWFDVKTAFDQKDIS